MLPQFNGNLILSRYKNESDLGLGIMTFVIHMFGIAMYIDCILYRAPESF